MSKKLKRVFIDIEYKTEKDLIKQFDKIKDRLLAGEEKNKQKITIYNNSYLCNFHQWYVNYNYDFVEQIKDDRSIIKIKSRI